MRFSSAVAILAGLVVIGAGLAWLFHQPPPPPPADSVTSPPEPPRVAALLIPEEVQPGDLAVLHVIVERLESWRATAWFRETAYDIPPTAAGGILVIPVSYYVAPDRYSVEVRVEADGFVHEDTLWLNVAPKSFVVQRLWATPAQTALRTEDRQAEDSRLVGAAKAVSAPEVLWEGPFVVPARGEVTTEFGLIRYINNVESGRHSGLDIANQPGTLVVAGNHGRVTFVGELYSSGLTVIIDHGLNLFTSYCHLQRFLVDVGDDVRKGQPIGEMGATGFALGSHLHWTVSVGRTPVNPWLVTSERFPDLFLPPRPEHD